jgi:hypothetical protein
MPRDTQRVDSAPRYLDVREFVELGLLQEVNRQFLHPLGLALEVRAYPEEPWELGGVWDYRDDPEGMRFAEPPSAAKAARVEEMVRTKAQTRLPLLGYFIQPANGDSEVSR